jgi:hypothetical protein
MTLLGTFWREKDTGQGTTGGNGMNRIKAHLIHLEMSSWHSLFCNIKNKGVSKINEWINKLLFIVTVLPHFITVMQNGLCNGSQKHSVNIDSLLEPQEMGIELSLQHQGKTSLVLGARNISWCKVGLYRLKGSGLRAKARKNNFFSYSGALNLTLLEV